MIKDTQVLTKYTVVLPILYVNEVSRTPRLAYIKLILIIKCLLKALTIWSCLCALSIMKGAKEKCTLKMGSRVSSVHSGRSKNVRLAGNEGHTSCANVWT